MNNYTFGYNLELYLFTRRMTAAIQRLVEKSPNALGIRCQVADSNKMQCWI